PAFFLCTVPDKRHVRWDYAPVGSGPAGTRRPRAIRALIIGYQRFGSSGKPVFAAFRQEFSSLGLHQSTALVTAHCSCCLTAASAALSSSCLSNATPFGRSYL